ncbi:hypothetical protein I314_02075 [Cryptococcus bacillisporus CA1873]|uniref:RRM domain-containing protein n=2 Tax=Cryptococcus gattii TaxID=552467 RepID=A0A0D0UKS6_CRYGA|nr:hypothetical protein I312_01903 [Cryptococcus bacillisporus CA1280]KIR67658.1 hypothetical protein I314_02075 [Cryptococcus bacillisporus CA1873]|eukprot:KIR67658.1 hypothetical protein I314_02075 [Cryptococcus gattii CA1873]
MSTTGYTIHVAGLAPETTEDKLHDFFSFCGKLTSVKKSGSTADITFEKLSAMRTSLMLNGGTLDGAHLEVTSTSDIEKTPSILPASATGSTPIGATEGELAQEDKPKAAIAAEYLAHGYVLGDHIVQKAIDLDHKQGISSRFLSFFNNLDSTIGNKVVGENKTVSGKIQEHAAAAVAKTREVDQSRGISSRFHEYYSKVIGTPVGQKVHQFYTTTQKQVMDVHEEAKRIAEEKKKSQSATVPADEPGSAVPSSDVKADIASSTTPAAAAASHHPAASTATIPPPPLL